jgi:hypothetical protein
MRERVLLNTFRGLVWVGVKVLSVTPKRSFVLLIRARALVQNMIII